MSVPLEVWPCRRGVLNVTVNMNSTGTGRNKSVKVMGGDRLLGVIVNMTSTGTGTGKNKSVKVID